jgi:hypothetical protein
MPRQSDLDVADAVRTIQSGRSRTFPLRTGGVIWLDCSPEMRRLRIPFVNSVSKKISALSIESRAGLGFAAIAQVDDLRFTTLAQTVQTTVIRKAGIPDASSVTRIVRDSSGIYNCYSAKA